MATPVEGAWPSCPYKGLNYYGTDDQPIFAGRRHDVLRCARLLAPNAVKTLSGPSAARALLVPTQTRVLLLQGSTGCGKTSFLRAGLIPFLEGHAVGIQFLKEKDKPQKALFVRSTDAPVTTLADELYQFVSRKYVTETPDGPEEWDLSPALKEVTGADAFRARFTCDPEFAVQVLDELRILLGRTLVLVLDQAEEVFTLKPEADGEVNRDRLFKFIALFSRQPVRVVLLVTLRTEYFGRFADRLSVAGVDADGVAQMMLQELGRDQLLEAIVQPTLDAPVGGYGSPRQYYHFSYEDGLAERIADDLLGAPQRGPVLPIMQIVCGRLFQETRRRGKDGADWKITSKDYKALGGLEQQVERHVDDVLRAWCRDNGLSDPAESRPEVERWKEVLYQLVRPQVDGTATTDMTRADVLGEIAEALPCRLDFARTMEHLALPQQRIVRRTERAAANDRKPVVYYSLGHDAIGLALKRWKTVNEKFGAIGIEKRLAIEERLGLVPWGSVYQDVLGRLGAFSGTVRVFNIELNVLDPRSGSGKRFFDDLFANPRVEKVSVTLPAHIIKRLEVLVADNPKLYGILENRVEVFPALLPEDQKQVAFVYYQARGDDRERDFCFILPKIRPFSHLAAGAPRGGWYEYDDYLVSSNSGLNARVRQVLDGVAQEVPFLMSDVAEFLRGEPTPLGRVLEMHGRPDLEGPMRLDDAPRPAAAALDVTRGRVLTVRPPSRGEFRVHVAHPDDDAEKPGLLWVPPWGHPAWRRFMKPLDDHLGSRFRVLHLQYAGDPAVQTFSGAGADIADAVRAVVDRAADLRMAPGKVAVVAVSLSAFVAAEVAAADERVGALCLLSPAIDLFDALDTFRLIRNGIELFTRRVYLAKEHYRASALPVELTYFGKPAQPHHLLDLRVRGARRCNRGFFAGNLKRLAARKCAVFLGASRLDQMLNYEDARAVCAEVERELGPAGAEFADVPWMHNIQDQEVVFDPTWDPQGELGIGPVVNFLRRVADAWNP